MSFQEELKLNIWDNMNIKQKDLFDKKPKPEMPIIGVQSISYDVFSLSEHFYICNVY